jgi:hypothetical protein
MNYLEEDLQLFELVVDAEEDGVFANSFVEEPAIERPFVFFNKQKEVQFQAIDNEKRLVAGPLLIPNKKIIRMDEQMGMYNVFFKPETIELIARKFMKNGYNGEVTVEHDKKVKDVYLTESWLIEQSSKDKSNLYGYTLPKGTWFGIYKVDNPKVWEEVKAGKYKGFSIEGIFEHKASTMKSSQLFTKDINDLNDNEADVLLSYIKNILKKDLRYKKKSRIVMESYNDYPESARNNACKVLRWIDEHGRDEVSGMTSVGLARANQLCKGENISEETIARMAAFERHRENSEVAEELKSTPWKDKGYVAWLGWGGTSGIEWAKRKLQSIRNE